MSEHTIETDTLSAAEATAAGVRSPHKSEGVPREARGGSFVPAFCDALASFAPAGEVAAAVEARGFYDAALMQQSQILAEVAVSLAGAEASLPTLEQSPDSRVRGVAPEVVRRALLDSPTQAVAHLRRQAVVPGTAIQEVAQMALKAAFIQHGLNAVMPLVADWIADPLPEVRRCLVEALRPRGVWTGFLNELRRDPAPLRPLLEPVLDDPSLYVRKAVANCLNDVGKDNPAPLLAWAAAWKGGGSAEREWVLTRGLRGLVREGDPDALRLLGLAPEALEARWIGGLPAVVVINQELLVRVDVTNGSAAAARVLIQATLSGPGRGARPRIRRYRIGVGEAPAGAATTVAGTIHFVDFNSQPKLAGVYELTLTMNGVPLETRTFRYEA
jgi:3-methyladenine DNA glycosylase AlkC